MRKAQMPARFPVGTRYVIEGKPGKGGKLEVLSRYLIMPNGRRLELSKAAVPHRSTRRVSRARRFAGAEMSAE